MWVQMNLSSRLYEIICLMCPWREISLQIVVKAQTHTDFALVKHLKSYLRNDWMYQNIYIYIYVCVCVCVLIIIYVITLIHIVIVYTLKLFYCFIWIPISLKRVPKCLFNKATLVQKVASRDKSLSEPMISYLTEGFMRHRFSVICVLSCASSVIISQK